MFTLFSGLFHPHLESSLVETVQRMKAAGSRSPFALIVPSESLRRRLQWLLCVENECALFNVHFLTFHQFALRLDAERRAVSSSEAPVPSLELVGDLFYEYALSIILQQDRSAANPFALRAESSGLCPALWRTIQDLQEAQVEPSVVLRGLQEGLFDEIATERLQGVLGLHAVLHTWSDQLGVGLPDDLSNSVIPWISQSPFISKLSSVIYYGFYDITQVQLSLLEEVARATAVTVFFPLVKGEASQFAQRFFDRYLLKAGVLNLSVPASPGSSSQEQAKSWSPQIQVVNALGPEGELIFTCKTILHHVEQTGYAWHEIGVVARNLDPYLPFLQRIFDAHRIPFWTTATKRLLEEPVAKVWWILAGLREEQFPWRNVLDVVTSPWYRGTSNRGLSPQGYSHLWVKAVHHFRLVGGWQDWERLAHVAQDPVAIQEWQQSSGVPLEQASESLRRFADVVASLIADCRSLPAVGSIGECTQAFDMLAKRHLSFPSDHPSFADDGTNDERNECLMEGFDQAITSLQQLDRLGRQVTWEQWMVVFRAALERADLPRQGQAQMGVQVLDVMAARGRPFRTLFVLGMNDHVFPRVVREDAFLRDRDRKVLAESLGYKIDEKLNGFDEEALLFALLHHSAQDHLYLLYQRADQNGRPLIPSSLLRDYLDGSGAQSSDLELTFPVGLLERSRLSCCSPDSEMPQESRLRLVLEGRSLQAMATEGSPWWNVFQAGMEAIEHLERSGAKAGPFDGLMEAKNIHWQDLVARGLSPTALGTYAQCPMRYWMTHVLKVGGIQDPMSKELSSRVWGELVHKGLSEVYQDLSKHGWPQQPVSSGKLSGIVNSQVDQVFEEYARKLGTGYRLIWDWMGARLTRMMLSVIEFDQRDYAEQGLVPYGYEVEAIGEFPGWAQAQPELLKIRGRFDRVDKAVNHSRVRIVDYKVSLRRSFQANELDLVSKALQGRQLQPPLYSFMTALNLERGTAGVGSSTSLTQSVDFRYLRPMQEESVHSASFSGAIWDTATGEQLRRTIHGWIQGIREGKFFIFPGKYCRSCQYASACRFQHHPSWSRAYGLPLARTYRQIRKQKAAND
ncbi:MAG: PD-(D/E)XK nuclease family protein [Nitrospirales bacterium]